MESNWDNRFQLNNGERKLSPITTLFVILQIIFFASILATAISFHDDEISENDSEPYVDLPELTINDFADKVAGLEKSEITHIQKKIFDTVSKNTDIIKLNKVEATIRDDSVSFHSFDDNIRYLNMLIDIPSLEQSYQVIYGSNSELSPEIVAFVLCLESNSTQIVYKNFQCKSNDDASVRERIAKTYISYFKTNNYTPYVDQDNPRLIKISPVNFTDDETVKAQYIEEVRSSITSLGLSPNDFSYYVRTASDVNYYLGK